MESRSILVDAPVASVLSSVGVGTAYLPACGCSAGAWPPTTGRTRRGKAPALQARGCVVIVPRAAYGLGRTKRAVRPEQRRCEPAICQGTAPGAFVIVATRALPDRRAAGRGCQGGGAAR